MHRFIYIPIIFFLFLIASQSNAQVQKVNYFMKYNETLCAFDFCIIIKEGQATTLQQRVQMNSQYTIVVPTGSVVNMVARYMPLQNNQNYGGTAPLEWQLGSVVIAPAAQPESDFHSIIPTLAPTSFYNNLKTNDTIRLFTLSITPVEDCARGIRIFNNQTDPGPLEPGMNGSNFSNGFTIGGITNRYDGNAASHLPEAPSILSLDASCSQGLHLQVQARAAETQCQQNLMYEWTGPEGFLSDEAVVDMPNAGPLQKGKYYISVKDSLGCSVLDSVQAYVKPDGGKDQSIRCFQSGSATLKAKGSGSWSFADDNPGTAQFSHAELAQTFVQNFSDPGIYKAIWFSETCSDTVIIQVGSECNCSIENTLELPSVFLFCEETNALHIAGNEVNEPGMYQWIYRVGQGVFQTAPGDVGQKDYSSGALISGNYEFRRIFTKTLPVLCSDTSQSVFIDILPGLYAGADISLFCFSTDTAFIQASGAGVWSALSENPDELSFIQFGNPQQTFYDFEVSGIYSLEWSNEACSDTLKIYANPYCGCHEANGGINKEVCAGDTISFAGTCSVGIWKSLDGNPAGDSLLVQNDGSVTVAFDHSAMGSYYYEFSVFDTLFDTIKIAVRTLPVINAGEDFFYCQGSPSVLLVAGGGSQYVWSTGENMSNIMVAPIQTTIFAVTGTDTHGCMGTDTIQVTVLPKPQGEVPSPPMATEGSDVILYSGTWTNASTFIWQGPGGFTSTQTNPVLQNVRMQDAGIYELTVMSEDDCSTNNQITLEVSESPLLVDIFGLRVDYEYKTKENRISWEVASLINHDVFKVERSTDLQNFKEIASVHSNNITGPYHVIDTDKNLHGVYYYRLVSIDYDHTSQIFGPVKVNVKEDSFHDFKLFPMPFVNELYIEKEKHGTESIQIFIYESTGALVAQRKSDFSASGRGLVSLNLSDLSAGVYVMRIISDKSEYHYPLIKME